MTSTSFKQNKTISLEEWEIKTQLSEAQRQSVLELQDACAELPLPEGLLTDFGSGTPQRTASPSLPPYKDNLKQSSYQHLASSPLPKSRSTTNLLAAEFQATEAVAFLIPDSSSLGITQPIETTQQFFDWFARMENDMERDQEDVYRQACDDFLKQIDTTAKLFNDLEGNFKFVEERTRALQTACETLLEEQNNLAKLADSMSSKLSYYNELETITKLFNSPGESICELKEFLPTLTKLDECLDYMQNNLLNSTVQTAVLYVKFKAISPKFKELLHEIEKRCSEHQDYMYDFLRPKIIHEASIDTLSELCTILLVHLNQDVEEDEGKEGQGLQFSYLIRNVLQDAQQRLVFRAQTYIRSEIQNYIAKPSDLDYPNKLKALNDKLLSAVTAEEYPKELLQRSLSAPPMLEKNDDDKSITNVSINSTTTNNTNTEFSINPADTGGIYHGWFPTLQRTLYVLSKLYQCVNTKIFDDIAQDVVLLCLKSLLSASETISKHSKLDGQLFLIKHLLILKDQIAVFGTQFVHEEKDLDFSSITNALNEILQNKYSILSPNTLFGLAQKGIPKVKENIIDSKLEVDKELKKTCEEFIYNLNQQTLLKDQNFASPKNIIEVYETFQNSVKMRIQYIMTKMSEYIEDKDTEAVLLKPIQHHIIVSYHAFYDILLIEKYEFENFPKPIANVEDDYNNNNHNYDNDYDNNNNNNSNNFTNNDDVIYN
ncbi:7890_t:CDS:10 [Entrophospora sp. SA101]|nr:7890_t:CDS:10 [Entrophospora sp. SA101]